MEGFYSRALSLILSSSALRVSRCKQVTVDVLSPHSPSLCLPWQVGLRRRASWTGLVLNNNFVIVFQVVPSAENACLFECHNMDCTCSERKYEVMQKSGMGFFSYLWECLKCCHNAHFELCICLIMRSNTYVLKSF